MLFECSDNTIESEKERNLYTKFFAGYYFNELIDGLDDRLKAFSKLINDKAKEQSIQLDKPILLKPNSAHVTFDTHAYLLARKALDRGELADILITDIDNKTLIPIEVKYLTNLSQKNDLETWEKRLNTISRARKGLKIVPCVLISERIWDRVENMKNHRTSNATAFKEKFENKVIMLFWENIRDLVKHKQVREYLNTRLEFTKPENKDRNYSWKENDFFVRHTKFDHQ